MDDIGDASQTHLRGHRCGYLGNQIAGVTRDNRRAENLVGAVLDVHFHEAVGLTPKRWLQRERMFRAQELLETSDSPLTEIAELCGYKSLETFRVAFRRALGTSPAAYRARFRRAV